MNPDEINEARDATPSETGEPSGDPGVEAILKANIGRRTFLAAAALGAAAAGFVNRAGEGLGLQLGPVTAFADGNTSSFGCTAQDVRLVGDVQVVDEPCGCPPGTVRAVQATAVVVNNAQSNRYCIIAHLPAQVITVGGATHTVGGGDLLLARTLTGGATQTATVTIANWVCGAGRVCFGNPTPTANNGKTDCPTGPCAAISWQTPNDSSLVCENITHADINKSKCHWQQICVVSRSAEITCTGGCTPTCGGVSTLRVCTTGGAATKTVTLGAQSQTTTACATFTVTTTATTTYTASVNFGDGCTSLVSTVITASTFPSFTPTVTGPNCAGVTTICASVTGATSYVFSEGGTALATATSTLGCATLTYAPTTAAQTHAVTVVASGAAGCSSSATATVTVNPVLSVSIGVTATTSCVSTSAAAVTFTATATGGSGSGYIITWTKDGTSQTTGTTYVYAATPDATAHTVGASVADGACTATATPVTVSQCVSTSFPSSGA